MLRALSENPLRVFFIVCLAIAALATAPSVHAAAPSVGDCLSATETSLKLRTDHQLRAARARLLTCSEASCPVDIREECLHRIAEVNAAIPTVVFTAKSGAGQELSDVKVTMDGQVVASQLDGSALTLDPGSHQFTFEIAGEPPMTETLILHEGEKNRREAVVIGPAPAAPVPAALPPVSESIGGAPASPGEGGHGRRLLGLVGGGAGIAGLAIGGIFGGLTFSSWGSAKSECPSHSGCSAQATSDRSHALTYGTVSTAGFIAGGVLLAAGLTLYLTAPRDQAAGVALQVAPGALAVSGSF